jgi:hypothetical protein
MNGQRLRQRMCQFMSIKHFFQAVWITLLKSTACNCPWNSECKKKHVSQFSSKFSAILRESFQQGIAMI